MMSFVQVCSLLLLTMNGSSLVTSLQKRSDDVSLESLMTLIQQQSATINAQQAALSSQQATIGSLQSRLTSLETAQHQQASIIADVNTQVSHVTTRLNTRVSFTAYMDHAVYTINDSPFLFGAVESNPGNGYNPQTGVFTAPVSGNYFFYAQILNQINTDRVDYGIFKAGQMLCVNHLSDHQPFYNTASCLATVHLQKGDTVFVKRTNDGTVIEGTVWCSFSGQLITADP